jgi:hypothetical protein
MENTELIQSIHELTDAVNSLSEKLTTSIDLAAQTIIGPDGLVDRVDAHSGLLEESIISLRDEVAWIKEKI